MGRTNVVGRPESVEQTIYIDTDAWFRDTVAGMWIERDPGAMIQWGTSKTSGVLMLSLKTMKASEPITEALC